MNIPDIASAHNLLALVCYGLATDTSAACPQRRGHETGAAKTRGRPGVNPTAVALSVPMVSSALVITSAIITTRPSAVAGR